MARFLLVLKPEGHPESGAMLKALDPVLRDLNAEVDHRTSAHLGAMVKQGGETQRMQLFADVQSKADGRVLELVLLSREAMGLRAPKTHQTFMRLLELVSQHLGGMTLQFRSDLDGPIPQTRRSADPAAAG
ncbi:hypothetical protein IQ216_02855 [Cyanobium sp. LEGE 06143]|jgi:hypothetical protein|uniref:hypothetical protein n=1 Tax=unclassified Cyanobium TaxID=2627006 RepID=UPI001647AAD6|nr:MULTISPECIES: hypothetical protein [unclassified Cyanobium]MBE9154727.1 hypothetical protein [Cyanobium sp. LEGE 06113]MBE9172059.1 hypothetical protein [Cyanobium sp. LEGE 06143]QNI70111.1 hypothetical protein CyaNS01_00974 [Cyanobium sp. NS01]